MTAHPTGTDTKALQREAAMMKLERFIAERELIEDVALTIPEAELIARYEQLYTGAISDVLREHCLTEQTLPSALVPLHPNRTVAGFAFHISQIFLPASARASSAARRWRFSFIQPRGSSSSPGSNASPPAASPSATSIRRIGQPSTGK